MIIPLEKIPRNGITKQTKHEKCYNYCMYCQAQVKKKICIRFCKFSWSSRLNSQELRDLAEQPGLSSNSDLSPNPSRPPPKVCPWAGGRASLRLHEFLRKNQVHTTPAHSEHSDTESLPFFLPLNCPAEKVFIYYHKNWHYEKVVSYNILTFTV